MSKGRRGSSRGPDQDRRNRRAISAERERAVTEEHDGRRSATERLIVTESYLPNPADLARYDDLVEGGAERAFAMAEREQEAARIEQDHRQKLDEAAQPEEVKAHFRGQYLGFAISVIALICATITALSGVHYSIPIAMVGLPVLSLAKAFIDRDR